MQVATNVETTAQKGVFITDITRTEYDGADISTSKINSYLDTTVNSTVVLGSDPGSYITYYVSVYNRSEREQVFIGPFGLTGEGLYDNSLITYELGGLVPYETTPCIIVAHCEDEQIIRANIERYKALPANEVDATCHPKIRTAEACLKSTERAVALATKYGARLHVAHLSTAAELALFEAKPLNEKKITAETCPHYLFFDEAGYQTLGYRIKCNPSIKSAADREALTAALTTGKIDTIGTDHAPHLPAEKFGDSYFTSASGMPSIQHSLLVIKPKDFCHFFTIVYSIPIFFTKI